MRIFKLFLVFAVCMTAFPQLSQAEPKPWIWGWWPGHWRDLDFKPYIAGDGKMTQRGLWDKDAWTPEAWINDAGDAKRIMRDLYAVEIVADQYTNGDDIPVLVVGENFHRLSGLDQRRVLKFIDHVFQITTSEENGMFFIYDSENDDDPIGVYDKNGFQQS